jgi:hypothetical protein
MSQVTVSAKDLLIELRTINRLARNKPSGYLDTIHETMETLSCYGVSCDTCAFNTWLYTGDPSGRGCGKILIINTTEACINYDLSTLNGNKPEFNTKPSTTESTFRRLYDITESIRDIQEDLEETPLEATLIDVLKLLDKALDELAEIE